MNELVHSNPLLDMMAAFIGFAAVMLFLSLIVTSIIQILKGVMGLSRQYFIDNLERLLKDASLGISSAAPARGDSGNHAIPSRSGGIASDKPPTAGGPAMEGASLFLDSATIVSSVSDAKRIPGDPSVPWIDADELMDYLRRHKLTLTDTQEERIICLHARLESHLSRYLTVRTRYVTTFIAFVIAFVFQVSAPHLLRDLSVRPEYRERSLRLSEGLLEPGKEHLATEVTGKTIPERALAELSMRFPDLSRKLEGASREANRTDSLREVGLILEGDPRKKTILAAYREIMDHLYRKEIEESKTRLKALSDQLAILDIVPFRFGWAFYNHLPHWLGMIVTALLLTLGAPFWYRVLRNMLNLRDVLKGQVERGTPSSTILEPPSKTRSGNLLSAGPNTPDYEQPSRQARKAPERAGKHFRSFRRPPGLAGGAGTRWAGLYGWAALKPGRRGAPVRVAGRNSDGRGFARQRPWNVCKRLFEERANDGDVEIFGSFPFSLCSTRGRMAVRGGPARLSREPKPSSPRAGRTVLTGRRSPARLADPIPTGDAPPLVPGGAR
jgi:hypothetical protein